ncbi:MAG: hydrogenase maturation nickel metallochaperone HypA [Firmicutes bacterium]|nr:hydrogenase maturation nickel metallochaperone HypA [Bacillota bacterium]
MHELALTQSILNIALTEATVHRANRVLKINIKVGVLSGILPELVQEYFNIVSCGTAAEQALLLIEKMPARISCFDCGAHGITESYIFTCPACNSSHISLLEGREFYVDSLEIE